MWRVWASQGWIDPGNFLIPPTSNLGGSHCIRGKVIHKHSLIDGDWIHMCHDHPRNACKSFLGVQLFADNQAFYIVYKELISPQISIFPCDQMLTSVISILPLVNIYISRRIPLLKHKI